MKRTLEGIHEDGYQKFSSLIKSEYPEKGTGRLVEQKIKAKYGMITQNKTDYTDPNIGTEDDRSEVSVAFTITNPDGQKKVFDDVDGAIIPHWSEDGRIATSTFTFAQGGIPIRQEATAIARLVGYLAAQPEATATGPRIPKKTSENPAGQRGKIPAVRGRGKRKILE